MDDIRTGRDGDSYILCDLLHSVMTARGSPAGAVGGSTRKSGFMSRTKISRKTEVTLEAKFHTVRRRHEGDTSV